MIVAKMRTLTYPLNRLTTLARPNLGDSVAKTWLDRKRRLPLEPHSKERLVRPMTANKLITIATFDTPEEANVARNRLDAEGIVVFLADEVAVGMAWHLGTAIGGVKLRVAEGDVGRAIAVLKAPRSTSNAGDSSDGDELDGRSERETEEGEEEGTSFRHETVARAFRAAVIGLFFVPLLLYSVWLLVHVVFAPDPLSPADRRRVLATLLIDLFGTAIALLLYGLLLTQ